MSVTCQINCFLFLRGDVLKWSICKLVLRNINAFTLNWAKIVCCPTSDWLYLLWCFNWFIRVVSPVSGCLLKVARTQCIIYKLAFCHRVLFLTQSTYSLAWLNGQNVTLQVAIAAQLQLVPFTYIEHFRYTTFGFCYFVPS